MKRFIKSITALTLLITIIFSNSTPVYAYDIIGMSGEVLFSGTKEECDTYSDYIRSYYMNVGGGYHRDGRMCALTYSFGQDYVRFDLEKGKMTWIDGSVWDITNNVAVYESQKGTILFLDDAVRLFFPEFEATHSLVPADAPANFSDVLNKHKAQRAAKSGVAEQSIKTEPDNIVEESFENFDEITYATMYPDLMAAFGTDKLALWNHYQIFGKVENRVVVFK